MSKLTYVNSKISQLERERSDIKYAIEQLHEDLYIFSVAIKDLDSLFFGFSEVENAKRFKNALVKKGIDKGNIVIEYTNNINDFDNVDNDDLFEEKDLKMIYDKWVKAVELRAPKKTKWDYANIDD